MAHVTDFWKIGNTTMKIGVVLEISYRDDTKHSLHLTDVLPRLLRGSSKMLPFLGRKNYKWKYRSERIQMKSINSLWQTYDIPITRDSTQWFEKVPPFLLFLKTYHAMGNLMPSANISTCSSFFWVIYSSRTIFLDVKTMNSFELNC